MESTFKVGDIVIYVNGDNYQLGEVKEAIYCDSIYMWQGHTRHYISGFSYNEAKQCLTIYNYDGEVVCELSKMDFSEISHYNDDEIHKMLSKNFEEYSAKHIFKYRVWYHTGDTTAITYEHLLHPIINRYAFDIRRKKCDEPIKEKK